MKKPKQITMAILKLYKANMEKAGSDSFRMDTAAMRKRLSLIYNIQLSATALEAKLRELEKDGLIRTW